MSPAEFDWWFDRNPAGPRILNEARDDDGTALGVLAMSCFRMSQGLAAYAVHAVTTPAARGRGVFSTLELHNEQSGARGRVLGARVHEPAGRADPRREARLGGRHVAADLGSAQAVAAHRRRRAAASIPGWRRSTSVTRHRSTRITSCATPSTSTGATPTRRGRTCASKGRGLGGRDARGLARLLVRRDLRRGRKRRCIAPASLRERRRRRPRGRDGEPGEERTYLAAGFVPTPRTIRFIGKRLTDDAPELPKERRAWRFTLGDLDFF